MFTRGTRGFLTVGVDTKRLPMELRVFRVQCRHGNYYIWNERVLNIQDRYETITRRMRKFVAFNFDTKVPPT